MINLFVLAFLHIGDTVLLIHRTGTNFGNGLYGLVGGKVEQGETALQAIRREIREEVAIDLPESAFQLVHTLHRKGTETEFISLTFSASLENQEAPRNNEPEKHDDVRFFKVDQLPATIIPAHRQIIEHILQNSIYSQHGW